MVHPSNALNVAHHSPTHTYFENTDTLPNSHLNTITTYLHYYNNFSKNQTREDLGHKSVTKFSTLKADIDDIPHTHLHGIAHSLATRKTPRQ
jgi:hypothetical protein